MRKDDEKSLARILLVELKDQVLFLPEYFAYNFQGGDADDKILAMNNDGVTKYLYFGGEGPNK